MLHTFIEIFVAVMATFGIYSLLHDIVDSLCRWVDKRQNNDKKAGSISEKNGKKDNEWQSGADNSSGNSGENNIPKQR